MIRSLVTDPVNLLQASKTLRGTAEVDSECFFGIACGSWESYSMVILASCLLAAILCSMATYTMIREEQEENITPLCPALIVKDEQLEFTMPSQCGSEVLEVTDMSGKHIVKLTQELRDPFRPGSMGVAATVKLCSPQDIVFATIVVRPAAKQGVALCRAGCEIFGFVEQVTEKRYDIRHRTGHLLMTMVGDFETGEVQCLSPAGGVIGTMGHKEERVVGCVHQHVDAGLVIGSMCATQLHKKINSVPPAPTLDDDLAKKLDGVAAD